jgi:hypothetical protein
MTASRPGTKSRDTYRCGCPRRLSALIPANVADELVRLYEAGAAVRRMAELSGLSVNTTVDVLHGRGVQLRRAGGRRAPEVTTDFPFPPRGGLPADAHDKHRPACLARQENMVKAHGQGTSVADIVAVTGLCAVTVHMLLRDGTAAGTERE